MDDRNEEFRRRLERISQNRSERISPPTADPVIRSAGKSSGGPSVGAAAFGALLRLLPVIIVPILFLVVLPWVVLNKLPALTAMLNLPTLSTGLVEGADQTETRDFTVRFDRIGVEYGDGQVANAEAKELALGNLASGGVPSRPDMPVKDVQFFDGNTTCQLRRPAADEKLANVYIRQSFVEAPVRAIRHDQLMPFLERRVGNALSDGKKLDLRDMDERRFRIADVYVTDTGAPLYLVLQSLSANTIWNIHKAPGVTISHVVMLSGGSSGLAGDIGDATFEAIRASDFGDLPEASLQGNLPDPSSFECMSWPFQEPNESWTAWKGSQDGNTLDGNLLYGQSFNFANYEYWYEKTLGANPNDNAVITASAQAALVGPIPAAPITFAPQDGLQLRLMRHDAVLTGTPDELAAQFKDHWQGILNAAAGGDYAAMVRPEIEVAATAEKPADVAVEGDDAPFLVELAMKNSPWEQDLQAMIDMTTSNFERRVGFTQLVPFESLLKPGEAMPPEDQKLLYAMLRAPQVLEKHCAETLAEIATKCRVFESRTQATASGEFQVDVTFGYVPNYAIGSLEKKSGWAFKSAFLPDTGNEPYDSPERRKAFLQRLMQVCDQLRAERGNCVISTAGFYIDQPANFSGGSTAWAAGWVSVYTPDNPFEEQQLAKQAEEIWASLQ